MKEGGRKGYGAFIEAVQIGKPYSTSLAAAQMDGHLVSAHLEKPHANSLTAPDIRDDDGLFENRIGTLLHYYLFSRTRDSRVCLRGGISYGLLRFRYILCSLHEDGKILHGD